MTGEFIDRQRDLDEHCGAGSGRTIVARQRCCCGRNKALDCCITVSKQDLILYNVVGHSDCAAPRRVIVTSRVSQHSSRARPNTKQNHLMECLRVEFSCFNTRAYVFAAT